MYVQRQVQMQTFTSGDYLFKELLRIRKKNGKNYFILLNLAKNVISKLPGRPLIGQNYSLHLIGQNYS